MNTQHLFAAAIAAAATSCSTVALADAPGHDAWARFAQVSAAAPRTLSRSEVLAELEIYQRSGLADLERPDVWPVDTDQAAYRQARARYDAMHNSPEFAARVGAIAVRHGDTLGSVAQAGGLVAR